MEMGKRVALAALRRLARLWAEIPALLIECEAYAFPLFRKFALCKDYFDTMKINIKYTLAAFFAASSLAAAAQCDVRVWKDGAVGASALASKIDSVTFSQDAMAFTAGASAPSSVSCGSFKAKISAAYAGEPGTDPESVQVGVCYSDTHKLPNLALDADTCVFLGTGDGMAVVEGLRPGTTYYYRAYVKVDTDVYYGSEVCYATTLPAGQENVTVDGHEFADLGLPSGLLWATCNVGAESATEGGDCFAWGETAGKSAYTWESTKWSAGGYDALTKYCADAAYGSGGFADGLNVLDASDDAATAAWGADCRMPTQEECAELAENCEWEWVASYAGSSASGYKVTSKKNGNYIFLPAAGFGSGEGVYGEGKYGFYWTSSLCADHSFGAYCLSLQDTAALPDFYFYRCVGLSVRPVSGKTE